MKKKWYDYLWIVSLTYLVLGLSRNVAASGCGTICFRLLQRNVDIHCTRTDHHDPIQAP